MSRVAAMAFAFCVLFHGICAAADSKPRISLAADGFPAGNDTPEGVAVDLARARIGQDKRLFIASCLRPFGGGTSRAAYEDFLKRTSEAFDAEAEAPPSAGARPVKIGKLFAARYPSSNGPASYAYAAFNFEELMFVDVGVVLSDGRPMMTRILVAKLEDGRWYAHPAPEIHPLLSEGLDSELPSTEDFSERYLVAP